MKSHTLQGWFLICLVLIAGKGISQSIRLISPDKKISVTIKPGKDAVSLASYTMVYDGNKVLTNARVGLELEGSSSSSGQGPNRSANKSTVNNSTSFVYQGYERYKVSGSWETVYGERKHVPENYNELVLKFGAAEKSNLLAEVHFRAYNEGFAFRYKLLDRNNRIVLNEELSTFPVPSGTVGWVSTWAQGPIVEKKINEISEVVERPLTAKAGKNVFMAMGEAGLVDYARMKFAGNKSNTLQSKLDGPVEFKDSLLSPWRYAITGKSPGELLEKNYLVLNLNEPNRIKDTRWIKPGKIIREGTLTTAGSYHVIDFAAAHDIQYIIFDAGWYGKEDSDTSDATRVSIDPPRYKGPLDLHKVIDYATKKNVGVILYVNRRALERQLDTLLPLFRAWGVKGIKFGFVNVGSQKWTSWLHESIRKAADYQMLVDVHDEYRPTGYSRTYPNLLTQEGIRGDEESPYTEQSIKTLFTRMIAGAGDNTICYFNNRVDKMSSHAAQMAKSLLLYSPLQFLYWYDSPAPSKTDNFKEGQIQPIADLKWFDSLEVVWDKSLVLEGEMEDYATMARKNGDRWFVGSLNGLKSRRLHLEFDFLDPGKKYHATIYTDDSTLNSSTNVRIETKLIDRNSSLEFQVAPRHGVAIRLTPINPAVTVEVRPLKEDWTYAPGETAKFRISVMREGKPLDNIPVKVEIMEERMAVAQRKELVVKSGIAEFEAGTMNKPGFLRSVVYVEDDKKKVRTVGTAAFSPTDIQPTVKMPADFQEFWTKNIREMKDIPLDPSMRFISSKSTKDIHVFEVSFQGSQRGSKVYGMLSMPARPGKYPAILKVPGAGVRAYHGDTSLTSKGIITLEIGIHGVPVTLDNQVYYDLAFGPLRGYQYFNMEDRDAFYYKRVYLNCIRALDFLETLPSIDSSRIATFGGSQGGALSIVTAALDKRVKYLVSLYPALSDLTGYLDGRAGGWPHTFSPATAAYLRDEEEIKTAGYYDEVNFAKQLQVPGWYAWGYNDEVCPPTSIYAVYNSITAPKEIFLDKPSGHWMTPAENEAWRIWLMDKMNLK